MHHQRWRHYRFNKAQSIRIQDLFSFNSLLYDCLRDELFP